jgi:GT2 family glycosyltransferase
MSPDPSTASGCVVIGRNEGDRLVRCLESALRDHAPVVYVDSGSTDDSVTRAMALGCEVVALDLGRPFTAARARNAGFARLRKLSPGLGYVQFVDGDCELDRGWPSGARARLDVDPDLAVVCGRRRERFPERSVFNELCDIEWDTPVGPALSCGGDALMRVAAFSEVGGFDERVIAGEEPELCVRLRARGWRIERLDAEMTLHDADMTRISQWWRRVRRSGYAFALGSAMHGAPPERHWVRATRRIYFWGGVVPVVCIVLAITVTPWALLAWPAAYGVSAARTYRATRARGRTRRSAASYALFLMLGRVPELFGALECAWHRARGRERGIIEYK